MLLQLRKVFLDLCEVNWIHRFNKLYERKLRKVGALLYLLLMATPQKKRRWDSLNTDTENNESIDRDAPPKNSNEAIKTALEVAKRLAAKLETVTSKEEDKEEVIEEVIQVKEVKEVIEAVDDKDTTNTNTVTTSSNNTSANPTYSDSLAFQKDSKNCSLFLDTSFPQLLLSKLQLGPSETFRVTVSVDKSVLEFEASSQDLIDLALKECKSIQLTGHFITKAKPSSEKILLGYDVTLPPAHASFLRGKLLGPQGSFLKHIHSVTRCRIQLRGKGSGHIEVAKDAEPEPLNLTIDPSGPDADVTEAKNLCEDLIATAKSEYEAKFIKPVNSSASVNTSTQSVPQYPYGTYGAYGAYPTYMPTYNPTNNPTNIPTNMPSNIPPIQPQSQEQAHAMYQQYQQALAQYYAQFTQNNKQP